MKKIYLGIFAAALSSAAVAQQSSINLAPAKKNATFATKVLPSAHVQTKGATLWSNTCDDITDWTVTNASVPTLDWSHETDAMASPRAEFQPFGFTTVADGFLFINSDAAGSGATQDASIQNAVAIDMSANSDINLVFDQAYRNYQETRTVSVSGDNGVTWTDYVIHDGASAVNTNTANPETKVINISAVAGGQSQVFIKFTYVGTFDWFWAIDDVKITELDDNDLKIESAFFGTNGAYGGLLPYYQVPSAQVAPVEFGTVITNLGGVDQTNTISTATTGSYTGVSAAMTSVSGATDTVFAATSFTPAAAAASHTVNYLVTSDSAEINMIDNEGMVSFDVTANTFARDNGSADGGSFNSGNGFQVGNIFDMTATADIYAVDVQISTSTNFGALVKGIVYFIEPSDGSFVFVEETEDYDITQTNIDNGEVVTLPLLSSAPLTAGSSYLVVAVGYGDGGATNDLVVATGGDSEEQTTFYFDDTDQTWYYTTSTPSVRMNFDMSVGVEENTTSMELGQNFPNPTNGVTSINYSLVANETIAIEITDITGKVITVINEGVKTAGTHTATFDASNLESGVYFYTLTNGNSKVTKTMTITK